MASIQVDSRPSAAELLAAVKRLPPFEFSEFKREFEEWQRHYEERHSEDIGEAESTLIATIRENSELDPEGQARYEWLRQKNERKPLAGNEQAEYLSLLEQLEVRNGNRLQAIAQLAKERGVAFREIAAGFRVSDRGE